MKRINLLIIFFLPALFFLSCSEESRNDEAIPLDIIIDSLKIGESICDSNLSISFHPPFLWDNYNTELSNRTESVKGTNKSLQKKFIFSPKYIFFKYGSNSILNIGEIECVDTSVNSSNRINAYVDMVRDKYEPEKFNKQLYLKEGKLLTHIRTELNDLVSAKYILTTRTGKIIQFEYTFRKNNEESEYNSIMSSIGTIRDF